MTGEQIRILFVDDERNVLRSLERLFLEEGYEVVTAGSGQQGLEALEQSGPFQLVVSDYRMPAMDGVTFLSEVCQRWPDTERMILSGYADTASIVAAINEGQIYKFIAKPWNDNDLLRTVRDALERHELRTGNQRLLIALSAANAELKNVNDNLNTMVDERLNVAMLQRRALYSFQNVLDVLPIGFVGADDCGMIVQCNGLGAELMGYERGELIGNDLATTLPAELLQVIADLAGNSCADRRAGLPGGRCRAFMTRICADDHTSIVVALLREP